MKSTFSSDFEAIYLRHDYLRKIDSKKINIDIYNKFLHISSITANLIYNRHKFNFNKVNFTLEDIVSIANVYLYIYLGLYSIQNNPEIRAKKTISFYKYMEKKYSNYTPEKQLELMDRDLLISFLKQKLYHCSIVCSRKGRNIIIGKDHHFAIAETIASKEASMNSLPIEYKKLGYRKVFSKELKEIKKNKQNNQQTLIDKNGHKIIEINILHTGISLEDHHQIFYAGTKNNYWNNPEDILCCKEEDEELFSFKQKFDGFSEQEKIKLLKNFINKNKNNSEYKKEIITAKELLNNYGII